MIALKLKIWFLTHPNDIDRSFQKVFSAPKTLNICLSISLILERWFCVQILHTIIHCQLSWLLSVPLSFEIFAYKHELSIIKFTVELWARMFWEQVGFVVWYLKLGFKAVNKCGYFMEIKTEINVPFLMSVPPSQL